MYNTAHRRDNSEASRILDVNDLSDLSDPEYFELDGAHRRSASTNSLEDRLKPLEIREKPGKAGLLNAHNLKALAAVFLWYGFSIGLSVYNKFMFSPEGMDFHFPVLTTSIHQLVQIVLAFLALSILRIPFSTTQRNEKLRAVPAGIASAADIGFGNSSLLIVTLSFYTMIKSSALGFVLLFSVLFKIEQLSWRLAGIVGIMTLGVFLMVAGEADFNLIGFFLVLSASCSSGLRWTLVKLLLSDTSLSPPASPTSNDDSSIDREHGHSPISGNSGRKPHPVQAILALSPVMFVGLAVWGLIQEGPVKFIHASLWKQKPIALGICYILFPGLLAFAMTWAEFELLNLTGPLTLAVAGICKEVATILTSILVFHDKLTAVNSIGIAVTIISIGLYHYHRLA